MLVDKVDGKLFFNLISNEWFQSITDIKSENIYMVPSIKVLASMIYYTFEQHAARECLTV